MDFVGVARVRSATKDIRSVSCSTAAKMSSVVKSLTGKSRRRVMRMKMNMKTKNNEKHSACKKLVKINFFLMKFSLKLFNVLELMAINKITNQMECHFRLVIG